MVAILPITKNPVIPEERRLLWQLRRFRGNRLLRLFPHKSYVARHAMRLQVRGFVEVKGGGGYMRLLLTARGNAYLDALERLA